MKNVRKEKEPGRQVTPRTRLSVGSVICGLLVIVLGIQLIAATAIWVRSHNAALAVPVEEAGQVVGENVALHGATLYAGGKALTIQAALYEQLAAFHTEGYTAVRVPVDFDAHMTKVAPYRVDEVWLGRLASFLEQLYQNGFRVILAACPDGFEARDASAAVRYAAMWDQIDKAFAHRSTSELWYEVSVVDSATGDRAWNDTCLQIVRNMRKEKQRAVLLALPENAGVDAQNHFLELAAQQQLMLNIPFRAMHEAEWQALQAKARTLETNVLLYATEGDLRDSTELKRVAGQYGFGSLARGD